MTQPLEVTESEWGPLSEPVHMSVPDGAPPWKDNAYLCFWDLHHDVFAAIHVSTSPNAAGRRARFSVCAEGKTIEIVEDLNPGTFGSKSIDFDLLANQVTVDAPRLTARIDMTPRFAQLYHDPNLATVPALVPSVPLQHYERTASVAGEIVVDGSHYAINGWGYRDRTWGYRDESANWAEYISVVFVFPTYALTCMRMKKMDGSEALEGHRLAEDSTHATKAMSVTRDASGLFAAGTLVVDGVGDVEVQTTARLGGFWVPMGWERTGPTLSTYDEFIRVRTAEGDEGFGLSEQANLRTLY
jgi:hypothetical protein